MLTGIRVKIKVSDTMRIIVESRSIKKYLDSWNMTQKMLVNIIFEDIISNSRILQVAIDNDFLDGKELQYNVDSIKSFIETELLPIFYKKVETDNSIDPRNYQEVLKNNTPYKQVIDKLEDKYEKYLDEQSDVWREAVESLQGWR